MKKTNHLQERFEIQLNKVETLLDKAVLQENPTLWLFLNDLRTPMFMLQGLSRIYAKVADETTFTKLKDEFKAIEDGLGTIDFYAAFVQEFATNAEISAEIKTFFKEKTKEKIADLYKILKKENWLNGKKLAKIRKKLQEVEPLKPSKEAQAIRDFYVNEIAGLQQFMQETTFADVEEDVHELRRKLRWLSIYPQGLQGLIQLVPATKKQPAFMSKYLTEAVQKSPFNQLHPPKEGLETINFDKNSFFALSWTIAELGGLKDTGLRVFALKEAIQETTFCKDKIALSQVYTILGEKQATLETLLGKAAQIAKTFFEEKHLSNLLLS